MASRLFFTAARNLSIKHSFAHRLPANFSGHNLFQNQLLKCVTPNIIDNIRPISFLQKKTGLELWESVTSVSNAGMKRGRGKNAKKGKTKNLNAGQIIGEGRQRIHLPGLNTNVKTADRIQKQSHDTPDPDWNQKLFKLRDATRARRKMRLTHMERGYSGIKLAGRSVGAPEGENFRDFDTIVIDKRLTTIMRWRGRTGSHSTFVATGNGNGIVGIGLGKSKDPKTAIRLAKKHAGDKLMHIQFHGRTIYHDFFTQFGKTKIYVYQMPEGYGIQSHRVIKTMCQLIGIKDVRAKIEGAKNPNHIVKAFLIGLLQQKTFNQMAEEKKMFLVEFSRNNLYFPKVVGRPGNLETLRKAHEIPSDEIMDFKQYCFNGKIPLKRPQKECPWKKFPTFQRHLKKKEKKRAWDETRLHLIAKYGKLTSFMNEKYEQRKLNEAAEEN